MERRTSIAEFLTDGSLAALCDVLTQLTDVPITLHAPDGRQIARADGNPPWRFADSPLKSSVVETLLRSAHSHSHNGAEKLLIEPITLSGRTIGALVLDGRKARVPQDDLLRLRSVISLLGSTVSEFCKNDDDLRGRNADLNILFKLSSLIVEARGIQPVLDAALASCMNLINADCGTVHLLDEPGENLHLHAHRNLTEHFVEQFKSLPLSRVADRDVISGAVRFVPDIIAEGRALLLEEIRREGLTSLVSVGLVFKGRPLGIMRLYSRRTLAIDPAQSALLETVAELISASVANTQLTEAERRHRQMQRQLRIAAEVQHRMLPGARPHIPGLDIGARYISSFELGGDFYDFIKLKHKLGFLVGDVVGKGIPAALLMASVRASLRAHALDEHAIDDVIRLTNRAMVHDTLDNEFATVFYGLVDAETLRFEYCSAGHEPPMYVRISQSESEPPVLTELDSTGTVIGIDASQTYDRAEFTLTPGDVIVAYTDGVIDAMNFQQQKFSRQRLRSAVLDSLTRDRHISAQAIVDHIVWEVRRFTGVNTQTDDLTIVAVRVPLPESMPESGF